MELYVNRRIRDKATVLGLPAERFMLCFSMMCLPVIIVVFFPVVAIGWIPWAWAMYYLFRNSDSLLRNLRFGKQLPIHLKNR